MNGRPFDPDRIVPPIMECPSNHGMKPCFMMDGVAIHTVTLPSGKAYAMIVHSNADRLTGAAALLNREEVEAHIALLRNAIEDAERINTGKAPFARPGQQTVQ